MFRPPPPPPAADMQFSSLRSVSPSFTSHSSNNLADIAARVVEEFRNENGYEDDDDIYNFDDDDVNQVHVHVDDQPDVNCTEILKESEPESDEDEEFEFDVSAGEIFYNAEILPRYPLFDRSLLLDDVADKSDGNSKPDRISPVVRRPLRKLFDEERESVSCSSSEADDLDGVAPGTYCVWKPKAESAETCEKSNSTGSTSKRWKFRNLLHRSNSDISVTAGKNASVIVVRPLAETKKRNEKAKKVEKTAKVAGADDDGDPVAATNESNSTKTANRTIKEGNRTRTYFPHKQDLVGVFANVNGLSRNLHPF